MDPQSRFLLEQTGAALADAAGSAAGAAPPNTGVYVGVMHIEFIQYLTSAAPGRDASRSWVPHPPPSSRQGACIATPRGKSMRRLALTCADPWLPAGLGIRVGPAVTTGNGMDFLVGRLSYTFGLTGAPLLHSLPARAAAAVANGRSCDPAVRCPFCPPFLPWLHTLHAGQSAHTWG